MRRLLPPASPPPAGPLAPLVDVFTLLLVFLLESYSTDPPVRPGDPDFALPRSAASSPLPAALAVDVTLDGIFLDGERVASSRYYLRHDDQLVLELYESVQGLGRVERLQLRADARVPWTLLRKVLWSLRRAGVERVVLAVERRSSL